MASITSRAALNLCLISACWLSASFAQAQTATQKSSAKPAAKSPAKPSSKAPMAAAAATALSSEQLSIAQIVTTGNIACADGQSVKITPDARIAGAFDLQFGKSKYDVVPMPSKTGAVRLEDPKSGIVFMQLANKSMLFNEKLSRRLADDCISPAQQSVADAMKSNPTPGVLDGASPAK